jgi:hypothetical protein
VDAATARCLRPAGHAEVVQHLVHDARRLDHLAELEAGLWIEIDTQLVRAVGVRASDRPRVEDDGTHLRGPRDVGQVRGAQLVGGPAARERDPGGLDPRRHPARRHPFLVEGLPVDAVREALQGGRPVPQRAHDPVTDGQIVREDVLLGIAALREHHLVGAGQAHRVAGDLDLDGVAGHAVTLCHTRPRGPPVPAVRDQAKGLSAAFCRVIRRAQGRRPGAGGTNGSRYPCLAGPYPVVIAHTAPPAVRLGHGC